MKSLRILIICALVCSVGTVLMSGVSATSQENIEGLVGDQNSSLNLKDAKNKIQAFLERKDIDLEYKGTMSTYSGDLTILESEDEVCYMNSQTKSIEGAIFFKSLGNSNQVQLNEDKAQKIAEDYAKSKYGSFTHKNMQLIRSDLLDHGDGGKEYLFVWVEIINDVLTPNYVSISINPNNGEIISYLGIERALNVDLKPEISKKDAIKTAIAQFNEIEASNVDIRLAVVYPKPDEQCLTWVVSLDGKENATFAQGGQVFVDAETGEIVLVDPYL